MSLLRVTNVAIYHTSFLTNLHIALTIIFFPFLSDIYACSDSQVNSTVQQLQIHELCFALVWSTTCFTDRIWKFILQS